MPEGGGGEIVATEDEGWAAGGFTFVLHAAFFDLRVVGECRVLGEIEGPIDERGVEVIDVAIVAEAGGAGLFIGCGLAEWDVAGLPVLRDFAGIDLVSEVAVDDVVGPDGGGERTHLWIDASDAGDEEVGVSEIEARVETEGHDGCGSACRAYAGKDAEDSGFFVEAEVVVTRGKGEDGV